MSQSVQRRRRSTHAGADLVHQLNQRYKEAFDRAEQLQAELNHIKDSRAGRILCWWRRLTHWRQPRPSLATTLPFAGENLDNFTVAPKGRVSILIPFKDRVDLLRNCLRSLRGGSYPLHEIILIDNGSTCPRMRRYLERARCRRGFQVLACPGPFNFSRLCNTGARQARGDYLLFLNNDVEVLTHDWLEHLLGLAGHPRVGVVGATLLYPDNTLQHAGIFPRSDGQWTHAYRGRPHDDPGAGGELGHVRAVPAVTGACLMICRDRFLQMGGFDEKYPLTLNDVDLCCRIRAAGLAVAITPHARLWHFESLSRGYAR